MQQMDKKLKVVETLLEGQQQSGFSLEDEFAIGFYLTKNGRELTQSLQIAFQAETREGAVIFAESCGYGVVNKDQGPEK